jgi:hypothetical protein
MEIKQFKLSSGEEIVCEVIEWPDVDEDVAEIVVRNIYKIIAIDQTVSGNRYYTFKPWMVFQDEPDMFQTININHVVGEANPSQKLLEQYFTMIKGELSEDSEAAREELEKKLADYIHNLRQMVNQQVGSSDSGEENVIKFPGGRTIH